MPLKVGDQVFVVEVSCSKRPRLPAKVGVVDGIYVRVDYDDKTLGVGLPVEFWVNAPRSAMDSCRRWRLMTEEA